MKKIFIYRGHGADLFCVDSLLFALRQQGIDRSYSICWADKILLRGVEWQKEACLLIFPGGRDVPYHHALTGLANRHILDFVQQGGAFLGLCAGGYYGSAEIEFEKGNALEVVGERELRFFPGLAKGPAYGPGKFCYQSERGAQIARLHLYSSGKSPQASAAYYNGGCAFITSEEHEQVTVIARYADLPMEPAAIVQCRVGKGWAILCGVHPEYSANYEGTRQRLDGHFSLLEEIEQVRYALFKNLLQRLNLIVR